jgi:hypothetical protein
MTHGTRGLIVGLVLALAAGGCAHKKPPKTERHGPVIEGLVVVHAMTRERGGSADFVPSSGDHHGEALRLTRLPQYQQPAAPMSEEIDLRPYGGKTIKVRYHAISGGWVWGAEVVE